MFKLRNSWGHTGWKGTYSPLDQTSWTSGMRTALQYDPDLAKQTDDGVFWIDYPNLVNYIECLCLNYNPGTFKHTCCFHE